VDVTGLAPHADAGLNCGTCNDQRFDSRPARRK
jgi:hypothetical protein